MAHELSFVNGKAEMFSGLGKIPWHGYGEIVDGYLTSREAIEAAHLGWKVGFAPVSVNGKELSQELWQATVREDNGTVLGIVKGRYNIIQNAECFSFMDSLVQDGELRYETAGALRDGRQVWMMARYDGDLDIAGDKHQQWLLCVTSHDGSKCLELLWTTVRVVCANTLSLALSGRKNSVKIRHCENWEDKKSEAQRVLGLTRDYFGDLKNKLSVLQDRPFNAEDMDAFTKLLYPVKGEDKGAEVPTRTSNMRWGTARLFNRPEGGTYGQTQWHALNAVTDFADHCMTIRGSDKNPGARFESAMMGSGAELKQKAYDLLTAEDFTSQLIAAKAFKPAPQVQVTQAHVEGGNEFARLLGQ